MNDSAALESFQLDGKNLFGYREGSDVFVAFSDFITKFSLSNIPPATLQRKKKSVLKVEQQCPAAYLKLFKAVNAVAEKAKRVTVLTLKQAQELLEVLQGKRLKRTCSAATKLPESEEQLDTDGETEPCSANGKPQSTHTTVAGCTAELKGPESTTLQHDHTTVVHTDEGLLDPEAENLQDSDDTAVLTDKHLPRPSSSGSRTQPERVETERVPRKKQCIDLDFYPALRDEMRRLQSFYLAEFNHKRDVVRGNKLSPATINKTVERIEGKLVLQKVKIAVMDHRFRYTLYDSMVCI